MAKRPKQTWDAWVAVTRPLYLRSMAGWPREEMRGYWEQGMSPLDAFYTAVQRRLRAAPDTLNKE